MTITAGKLSEHLKLDEAIVPDSLASTTAVGQYFSFSKSHKALVAFTAAAMAVGETVAAQILEATDSAGTGSQDLTGALATIAANASVQKMTVTASTVIETDVLVVNGVTFTALDTAPDASLGQWDTGADDTAAMANLAAVINGLLGDTVLASSAVAVLTLEAVDPGYENLTVTTPDATMTPATTQAVGYVEIDATKLSSGFSHFALELTTVGTIDVAGTLIRDGDYMPADKVAAGTAL